MNVQIEPTETTAEISVKNNCIVKALFSWSKR